MVALAYPESVGELVDFALMLRPQKSKVPVYALHVVRDEGEEGKRASAGKKILEKAVQQAAGAGEEILPLLRYDANISNGIVYSLKEHHITDLVIGLPPQATLEDFGSATVTRMMARRSETLFIYKPVQPINTLKAMIVVAPRYAETDPGFEYWFQQVITLARDGGMSVAFYAPADTLTSLEQLHRELLQTVSASFSVFEDWEDFLFFSGVVGNNDLFIMITSRPGNQSYEPAMKKLPYYLTRYFKERSCMLLFPQQAVAASLNPRPAQAPPTLNTGTAQDTKKGNGWQQLFKRLS
jgi:hypothetical protein